MVSFGKETPHILVNLLLRHWCSINFSLVTNRPLNGQFLRSFFLLNLSNVTKVLVSLDIFVKENSSELRATCLVTNVPLTGPFFPLF